MTAEGLDSFLENTIDENMKAKGDDFRDGKDSDRMEGSNFVDVLLNVQENDEEIGISLSRNNIKAFILVYIIFYRNIYYTTYCYQNRVK